jgi:ABC-type glutathione transport system ATPase component
MSRLNQPLLRVQHLSHSYVQRHALTNAKFTVSAFADVHLTVYPGTTRAWRVVWLFWKAQGKAKSGLKV